LTGVAEGGFARGQGGFKRNGPLLKTIGRIDHSFGLGLGGCGSLGVECFADSHQSSAPGFTCSDNLLFRDAQLEDLNRWFGSARAWPPITKLTDVRTSPRDFQVSGIAALLLLGW